jgi:hypothetical protein
MILLIFSSLSIIFISLRFLRAELSLSIYFLRQSWLRFRAITTVEFSLADFRFHESAFIVLSAAIISPYTFSLSPQPPLRH